MHLNAALIHELNTFWLPADVLECWEHVSRRTLHFFAAETALTGLLEL